MFRILRSAWCLQFLSLSQVWRHKWDHFCRLPLKGGLVSTHSTLTSVPIWLPFRVCLLASPTCYLGQDRDRRIPSVVFDGRTFLTALLPSLLPSPFICASPLPFSSLPSLHYLLLPTLIPPPLYSLSPFLPLPSSLPGTFYAIILWGDSQALYPQEETAHEMQKGMDEELAD